MSAYVRKDVVVIGSRGRRSGQAIVDSASPHSILPEDWAKAVGVRLGPVMPDTRRIAGREFLYRVGKVDVSLAGGCKGEETVLVPFQDAWHSDPRFGGCLLLGSQFLQRARARIDYGKKYRGEHVVSCRKSNPDDETLSSFEVVPEVQSFPVQPWGRVVAECPVCHRRVPLVRGGKVRAHDYRYERCRGSGTKVA